ncbi:MAG: MOSC domain-containing protein [Chromatiales bacterium]|jgi:uncharacterized protein YcbX
MSDISLTALYRYPVKSLAGEFLSQARLDAFGLHRDRRWMLVDREGRFLSQRELPRMALINPRLQAEGVVLQAPGCDDLSVRHPSAEAERVKVEVWNDRCVAQRVDPLADAWLSDFLGQACRLVYMPDESVRPVDPRYAKPQDRTAFSDGFPLLLISQASLDDLNGRLAEPLPMLRFRPNLVIEGCAPYAEDDWRHIRIGDLTLRVVKPCSRCKITTVDPYTGESGSEPLKTLAGYRRRGNQVYFGQNLIHDGPGELALDMPVEVLE